MNVPLETALMYDTSLVGDEHQGQSIGVGDEGEIRLVERARVGDGEAFEELVRRYRNDVFALAYHYVRNREDAWDLSQEVFIKAHRGLKRFRGDASLKTWLLRITANRCKDHFKKRKLRTVAMDEGIERKQPAGRSDNPDVALEARELGEAIHTALGQLPEKQRTAFVLREFEGLSYEEMAGVMACSSGTVMSRLYHARQKLQSALKRMGVVEDW